VADLALPAPTTGRYATELLRDPFAVSLEEKVATFAEAAAAAGALAGVTRTRGTVTSRKNETWFAASNGTRLEQAVTLCGGGLTAIAAANGVVQTRTYPKAFEGNVLQGGWEQVEAMNLRAEAPRMAAEAVRLSRAEPTPAGLTTVILGGAQLSLQIHESVGHPTELDRALGEEISLAGASWARPASLGSLRYGSELVNLTADSTTPGGPGTFGFDDEGTPAGRWPLVSRGELVGYLSGRDAAARLGRSSAACLRAESWSHLPIVRMVNVNLAPGAGSLDDLIAGVDQGLLIDVNKSWSIDDLRLNFQFSCEVAWEIRGGRLTGRLFRDPIYYGVTPRFWGACSAIAGPEAWRVWGWTYCGKGDPMQLMHVGHGCAPARFDGVQVGSTS
jgi:TldD protein